MAKKPERKRRMRLYAAEKIYPTGKKRMEADHMPGVWSRVLGNTAPPEYQTVRSDIKDTLYILRNKERGKIMRKIIAGIILAAGITTLSGCSEASRVSYNLSEQADNFNDIRQVTVINCITGDTLFQMTGKMSITADVEDNQLEVIVEDEKGEYKKHFIGLSNNVTYVVEDVTAGDVEKYKYTLNFNPKMWIPAEAETID